MPSLPIHAEDEQVAVLDSTAPYNLIDGNAGAAKTTTLAMKLLDALNAGHCQPGDLLVLTYSDAAVLAFQQRLRWLGLPAEAIKALRIQTFSQFCHQQLEPWLGPCAHRDTPNRQVWRTVLDAIGLARERCESRGHADAFDIPGDGTLVVPSLLNVFRHMKGTMAWEAMGDEFVLTPASALDAGLDYTQAAVLRAYEHLRCTPTRSAPEAAEGDAPRFRLQDDPFYDMARALTAPDPLFDATSHPLQLGLRLLMVDEGHDLNRAMFTVLQHLVLNNPHVQLFVVGDVDQVVHAASGADRTFMGDTFERDIGPAHRLSLIQCRRFGDALGAPLGQLATKPYATLADKVTTLRVVKAPDAERLAALIQGAHAQAAADTTAGAPSVAVLLRHPGHAVQLENALAALGFTLDAYGFKPYLQRAEILFVRVLAAWSVNELDTLAHADLGDLTSAIAEFTGCLRHQDDPQFRFSTVREWGRAFLGDVDHFLQGLGFDDSGPHITRAEAGALASVQSLVGRLRSGIEPSELPPLLREIDLSTQVRRALVFDDSVAEALSSIHEFAASAQSHESLPTWLQQIGNREFSAAASQRKAGKAGKAGQAERRLRAYTIPAAKGLEFDHVIIPDLEWGEFSNGDQEERNLFYVAASRARKQLTMTYRNQPSLFLEFFQDGAVWDEMVTTDASR